MDRQQGKLDTRGGKFSGSPVAVVDFDTFDQYNVSLKSGFVEPDNDV